jgi:hypothetical protein
MSASRGPAPQSGTSFAIERSHCSLQEIAVLVTQAVKEGAIMRRFISSWPMLYWSRERTVVLLVAMLAALATLLILAGVVGGY